MRDPKRIDEILEKIKKIWQKFPDMRLGQLLENIFGCEKNNNRCVFYREDDEILTRLKNFKVFTRGL